MIFLAACPPTSPGPCSRPPQQTLVFYDQSASSVVDPRTEALFRDTLEAVATSALQCPGDAVHGFPLHGNTRGKVDRVDLLDTIQSADPTGKTKVAAALAKTQYEQKIASLHEEASRQLLALGSSLVAPGDKRHTDMLGSLEVLSDELKGDSASSARVYYLSDMRESMPAPGRDFDAHPPSTRAEAENWATADVARVMEMSVDTTRFKNVHVRVLLGNLAAKPHGPEIRAYWERLFAKVGFRSENLEYN
ncbi:MAG TPA: hypothetical protein VFE05_19200 [Longimicrobiaceae bacterium]|nr:hypothetical protein [Longimicrobiaceae bacterium]